MKIKTIDPNNEGESLLAVSVYCGAATLDVPTGEKVLEKIRYAEE
jgi:hypothetical protein